MPLANCFHFTLCSAFELHYFVISTVEIVSTKISSSVHGRSVVVLITTQVQMAFLSKGKATRSFVAPLIRLVRNFSAENSKVTNYT